MNKQATYLNRYRNKIVFTQEGDTVVMTGYNPEWLGCSYENDYDTPYQALEFDMFQRLKNDDGLDTISEFIFKGLFKFSGLNEKDIPQYKIAPKEEFIKYLFEYDSELKEYKCPQKYRDLCKSTDIIHSVDPSGGPYIAVGFDLNEFFNDGIEREIKSIQIQPNQITFKL